MSVKAITQLAGMPKTGPGVHKKAKRENWSSRKQEGVQGAGVEYLVPASYFSSVSTVRERDGAYDRLDKPVLRVMTAENSSLDFPDFGQMFADEFALIPGYRIGASSGNVASTQDQLEPARFLAFRHKWMNHRGFKTGDLAIVLAKGDSMEPTIHNNDTLVVHLGRNKPSDGHIYIFRNGDELFVKRFQNALDCWLMISDNPRYETIPIPLDKQSQYDVVGQVVHIGKDIGD